MPNERPDPGYSAENAPWSSEFDDGRMTEGIVRPDGSVIINAVEAARGAEPQILPPESDNA